MELELFILQMLLLKMVHVRTKFFSARHLSSGAGDGLFASLKAAVEYNEC